MPLAFTTLDRGVIPFGFFNVKSHMVLLAEYFAFADEVCAWIEALAGRPEGGAWTHPAWRIARDDVGDLHGAMAGTDLSGFIGAVYRLYPFPTRREDFHQDPGGHRTRESVAQLIPRFAERVDLAIVASRPSATVDVGGYTFDPPGFGALVHYLWRGGMPRWTDDVRPDYVESMMAAVRSSASWLFSGQRWPEEG